MRRGNKVEIIRKNVIETLKPGETVTNMNPGGGGYGNPYERPIEKVVWDVKNGLVSINGALRGLRRRHQRRRNPARWTWRRLRIRAARQWLRPADSNGIQQERVDAMRSQYRLGIDAGGTFTDFVLADQTGNIRLFKVLSTPSDPTLAIRDGLQLIADDLGESPAAIVSECDLCINGTTVGLNALIQHKGGKTGLICTAGPRGFDRDQAGA